jgi:DNA-binding NtrC family response regulator
MGVAARILVVDDDPAIRKIVRDRMLKGGFEVDVAPDGEAALAKVDAFEPDLLILDLRMPKLDGFGVLEQLADRPRRPAVIVITAHGSIDSAVRAIKMGAADFIAKPFDGQHLDHVVQRILETHRLRQRVVQLQTELSERHTFVTGSSAPMQRALEMATRAAASNATILIRGESGTGKELLARHAHLASSRASGPFCAINCATLGRELLESDLFGHERGAFTGAHQQKQGRFEAAAGGTIFLDEIAELAPELQAKLLRVLQEQEFERVGGTKTIKADVRVIAATHQDLEAAIRTGSFREDLYYRLNVISVTMPPLRERSEDIDDLIEFFLDRHGRHASRPGLRVGDAARRMLLRYTWPGNVRELSNVIERAVVLAADTTIGPDDIPEEIRDSLDSLDPAPVGKGGGPAGFHEAVREAKREIILRALEQTEGHQTNAARLLGLTQPYLARLIKNLGVARGD